MFCSGVRNVCHCRYVTALPNFLVNDVLQYGIGLTESNKEIGGFLNKMQGMFLDYDNVLVEKIKNGTGPWIYKIYPCEQTNWIEENPFI